jgi:hypothetical protein
MDEILIIGRIAPITLGEVINLAETIIFHRQCISCKIELKNVMSFSTDPHNMRRKNLRRKLKDKQC